MVHIDFKQSKHAFHLPNSQQTSFHHSNRVSSGYGSWVRRVERNRFICFILTKNMLSRCTLSVQRINFGVCVVSELMNEAKECHRKSFFFVQDKEDHEQREKHVFIVCIKEKERQQQKHASKHLFILAGSRIFGTNSAVFHSVSVL